MSTFFIVRHKSGAIMQEIGRGRTFWEPGDKPTTPRLFNRKQHALAAVKEWEKGTLLHRYYGEEGDFVAKRTPRPERKGTLTVHKAELIIEPEPAP